MGLKEQLEASPVYKEIERQLTLLSKIMDAHEEYKKGGMSKDQFGSKVLTVLKPENQEYDCAITVTFLTPEGRLEGRVHGDRQKRFRDGEHVVTSPVVGPLPMPLYDGVFTTRNGTRYMVYWKLERAVKPKLRRR